MAKTVEDHLPKKAPKKTGKAGIKALEVDEKTKSAEPGEHKPELLSETNKKKRKNPRLPGMEDAEIEELEDAAREYANLRDDRMNLLNSEVEMKEKLLDLMKRHKKEKYVHDGVEIKITHEKETIKVKIKKDED